MCWTFNSIPLCIVGCWANCSWFNYVANQKQVRMVSFVHALALDESRIIRLINPPPNIFHHCQRSSMSGDDVDDTTSGNEIGTLLTEHKTSVWILEIVERTQLLPDRCKDGPKNCQIPSRAPGASALRAKRHSPAESKALILVNWNRETMRPNAWNGFLRFKLWTCNMTVQNAKPLRSRVSRLFQAKNPKLQSSPVFSIKVHCSLGDYIWLQPSSNRSF